jgi:nucleoside-diphosphate-sugar epimerase
VVVHAAAAYKDPGDWQEDVASNVVGTVNVVKASERAGVGRLVYFQTALCYGLHPVEQPITLSHPVRPEGSSYAISKTAGEDYIGLSALDFISFRLANAYGPRNLSGPLPTFYHRLTSNKPCFVMDTRRDFIFVDDLVDCVMRRSTVPAPAVTTTSPPGATTRSGNCMTPPVRRWVCRPIRTSRYGHAIPTMCSRSCWTRRKRSATSSGG